MRTESHIWVCACAQVLVGRMQEERDFGHRLRGEAPCIPAQPQAAGANLSPVSSAADAESQNPDSTNNVESEAPRDYFLKCKWTPGLSPLPAPDPPEAAGLGPTAQRLGFPPSPPTPFFLGGTGSAHWVLSRGAESCWSRRRGGGGCVEGGGHLAERLSHPPPTLSPMSLSCPPEQSPTLWTWTATRQTSTCSCLGPKV